MLKVEINEKGIDMTAAGDVPTLVADVSIIVGGIYEKLKASNEKCADAFKNILKDAINDDVVFATNEEEFERAKKKSLEEDKKKIDKLIQSIFDDVFKKDDKANDKSEDEEDDLDTDVAEDDEDIEELKDDEDVKLFFDNLMKDLKDINGKLDKLDKATRCNRFSRNKK